MSRRANDSEPAAPEDEGNGGPNLTVLYTLLVVALLAAIFVAGMVVWPFYIRR